MSQLINIIEESLSYEEETEWIEFKTNVFDIDEIGQYISALSNSATIFGKSNAYIIWGIENITHKVVGTTVNYNKETKNEPIQHYLARKISPSEHTTYERYLLKTIKE